MPKKKIYFACSIRGGGDTSFYKAIVDSINSSGNICLSEVFIEDAIETKGSPLPEDEIYKRDIGWIQECEGVIAEVTSPSLGVGYEIAYAEKLKKPVLALFNTRADKKLSAMISGNPTVKVVSYVDTKAIQHSIAEWLERLR